jgi:hypothetical protein
VAWNDLDGDAVRDVGEPGLAGWTIELDNDQNGVPDATTVTAGDGGYSLTGLAGGTHWLTEDVQAGWTQTFPTWGSGVPPGGHVIDSFAGTTVTDVDFGNQ